MFQVTYYFNQSDYIISVLYSQAMLEFVYDVWSLFESYLQWPIFICINVNLSFKPRSLHCPGQNRTWDVWLTWTLLQKVQKLFVWISHRTLMMDSFYLSCTTSLPTTSTVIIRLQSCYNYIYPSNGSIVVWKV